MGAVRIRPAIDRDLDQTVRLIRLMYEQAICSDPGVAPGPEFEHHYRQQLSAIVSGRVEGAVLVAVDSVTVIGVAEGSVVDWPYLVRPRRGFVSTLYVAENRQRAGLGRRLAETLIDWFRDREVDRIELNVLDGNRSSIGFWTGLGFGPAPQHRLMLPVSPQSVL